MGKEGEKKSNDNHKKNYYDNRIKRKERIRYLIKASISGANSCFGRNGQKFVTCSGINFSFGDCSANRSGTGVAQGQFPELFQTM